MVFGKGHIFGNIREVVPVSRQMDISSEMASIRVVFRPAVLKVGGGEVSERVAKPPKTNEVSSRNKIFYMSCRLLPSLKNGNDPNYTMILNVIVAPHHQYTNARL